MKEKEQSSFDELHKSYWQGLFSGFVARAKREGIPPMAYLLNVDDAEAYDPRRGISQKLSAQVIPVLSFEDTGLPGVLNMQFFQDGRLVAKGAAKAEWSGGLPEVSKIEYTPCKTEGVDETMMGEVANNLGQYLERPDEYIGEQI